MSDAPRLVIVADDGGFDAGCDAAIAACVEAGSVRGVAVSVNGATAPAFCRQLRDQRVDLGLHLNLTEGRACAGSVLPLTDNTGAFILSKGETFRALDNAGLALRMAVATEISTQLDTFEGLAGAPPAFINGHNHIHAMPVVHEALRSALEQRGWAPWIRIPRPAAGVEVPEGVRAALTPAHLESLGRLCDAGLPCNDAFVGYRFADDPSHARALEEIDAALAEQPTGLIEWMAHPGQRDGSAFCDSPHRVREHERLLEIDALKAHLATRGLEPRGFPRRASS